MKRTFYLTFLALLFIKLISSQNANELFIKLVDNETSEPISFATIIVKDLNLGVIADYNGEFRIPLKYRNNAIIVSCIGYRTEEILLNTFSTNEINIIKISPQIEALETVIINSRSKINGLKYSANGIVKAKRNMTAKEIVLKAIKKIPENLSDEPHSYIGYYRDYQLVDNKFHNLNEATLETFDNGITTNSLEGNEVLTAIYSFKQNTSFIQDTSLTKTYNGITKYIKKAQILPRGGNEYTILNIHNPVRNFNFNTFSYVYTLERDFPNLHEFRRDQIVYLDNEPLALIKFKKAEPEDNSLHGLRTARNKYVEGSLYISLVDYSIHRFNYKVFLSGTKNVLFNVSLEYARQNNKMYLNYISFNNSFVIGEDFELREEKVEFNQLEQAFYITFNNTKDRIDPQTISSRNFRFKLGKQYLKTISAEKIAERIVKVTVKRLGGTAIEIDADNVEDLTYKFKRIKDVVGREIYEQRTIEGDQFREFFVQKVNLDKSAPNGLKFMKKNLPIKESLFNNFPHANQYWINSPLMNKKYRDQEN